MRHAPTATESPLRRGAALAYWVVSVVATAWRGDLGAQVRRGVLAGAALLTLVLPAAGPPGSVVPSGLSGPAGMPGHASAWPGDLRLADFGSTEPGPDARALADWIAGAHDNADLPFVILDKQRAALFVFDAQARLRASSAVLLGAARGDESVAGIGSRPIALVQPHERTTPAGRFVAERGRNAQGEDVIWVDYDAAVSMHRLRPGEATEQRAERLATPTASDNRISYGCINVPVAFYESHIRPLFAAGRALVYVMPEVKTLHAVFGMAQPAGSLSAASALSALAPRVATHGSAFR